MDIYKSIAHLSCRYNLKGSESRFQVGGVGLQIIESAGDAHLELRRVLARWARRSDLVEGAHVCCWSLSSRRSVSCRLEGTFWGPAKLG
jgi:hypothetical protein